MQLLFEHKIFGFWALILVIPIAIFLVFALALKDFTIENQKITIECSKAKNFCSIEKTYAPDGLYHFAMKRSDLIAVDKKYVNSGCYDIDFYYGKNHLKYSLYGSKNCSTNLNNLNDILMKTSNYIFNDEEYLFIKTGDKFYLYWMDYLAPVVIILFGFAFFVLSKKDEIYFDSDNKTIVVKRYNVFNHPFKKEFKLSMIEKFYSKYFNNSFLITCRFKDKKEKTVISLPTERQNDTGDLCDTLNGLL